MKDHEMSVIPSARQIIDNMLQAVMITDLDSKIIAVNSTFTRVTGYEAEEVIGQKASILQSRKHHRYFYQRMWDTILKTGSWSGDIQNKRKNGDIYTEMLTITTIKNGAGVPVQYMGVFTDISQKKQAEETIKHMAYYDSLTDLPNRALFRDRLKQAIAQAQRQNNILGVLFLDLDRVKVINDSLGHHIGDQLLKSVAERLKESVRECDTVARMGGDEFTILLPDILGIDSITRISKKILESLHPPFHFDGHQLFITASIGISVYPFDSKDAGTLMKNADTAMYKAKNLGRNNFQFFTPDMKDEAYEQLTLEHDLRRALEHEEFVVHYQPQINIASGKITGMEALVRWQHPELGLIYPKQFIPWAEESGLIVPLGKWVLQKACEQNKKWINAGFPPLRVSVNLSTKQFNEKGVVKSIAEILSLTGLAADYLEIEITESTVMEQMTTSFSVPHELKAMGIRLAIDDFGTGYSSLTYLKKLPVNTLKMDQSFVQDLTSDPNDAAIALAVINLGHGLDLRVLAEGVETEQQLDFLKKNKCDGIQGFLFSPPLSADEFTVLLEEKRGLKEELLFSDC